MVLYTVHVTCQDIDGEATEADGGGSVPVGPSVRSYTTGPDHVFSDTCM